MDLYDELPEPPRLPGPAVPPPDSGSPHGNSTGKRRAETTDSDSYEDRHQEKKRSCGSSLSQTPTQSASTNNRSHVPVRQQRSKRSLREGLLSLKAHVAERRGEREELQDAHTICDLGQECQPMPSDIERLSYFAVFDGHGGSRASRFAAHNLHRNVVKKLPRGEGSSVEKAMKKCLLDAFKQTDEDFLKQAASQKPAWKDGTTALCVLVADNILYIANLGDSRALLCRINEETQKHTVLSLSREHNPTQYEERMRIQRAGGNVRDGRVLGVLEVSRSLGDGQYKRLGVISIPEVKRCPLTHSDRFVLMACDGLFKAFSPEEAVTFILNHVQEESSTTEDNPSDLDARYEAACHRLANEAVRRGAADNVTVLLVQINH